MINFNFLKVQIKSSIWIAVGIALVPVMISILSMSFTPYFWDTVIETPNGSHGYGGAINLLALTNLFGPVGEIIALAFAVALAIKLINIEVSKGYMSSWLSLPMTRISFFLTKIFAIFIASLVVVLPNLIIELMIVGIKGYPDFGAAEAGILFKANLGLLLTFLVISSITVLFSIIFNQTSYAITLSIVVPFIFIVFSLLANLSTEFNVSAFKYFKYLTFFSFYDFKQIMEVSDINFIWKFVLLLVLGSVAFVGSGYWFKRKNLYI